jgi:hypothetical protein
MAPSNQLCWQTEWRTADNGPTCGCRALTWRIRSLWTLVACHCVSIRLRKYQTCAQPDIPWSRMLEMVPYCFVGWIVYLDGHDSGCSGSNGGWRKGCEHKAWQLSIPSTAQDEQKKNGPLSMTRRAFVEGPLWTSQRTICWLQKGIASLQLSKLNLWAKRDEERIGVSFVLCHQQLSSWSSLWLCGIAGGIGGKIWSCNLMGCA